MIRRVNIVDFVRQFEKCRRRDNFTLNALEALLEYYEAIERETGKVIELNVHDICYDWTEYRNEVELLNYYGYKTLKEVEDRHVVIKLANDHILLKWFSEPIISTTTTFKKVR